MENNQNQINPEVKKVAPEYESHKKWMKENSVMINARLLKSTDADILEYLEGKNKQAEIKKGLRYLIAQEKGKNNNDNQETE
ncbi:MAG: hypothetical protein IKM73_00115 [Acidaminococcaceae bacterium]|nr:hypothetical protein [Acidaminococcaceae bacterium]